MMKSIAMLLLCLAWLFPSVQAIADSASDEAIKRYDIGYYHPERFGLRDLTFEVRVDGLTEKLNQQLIFGKLSDVFFKVYWMQDETGAIQSKVLVIGMPNGFEEMKKGLKQMVTDRLDYVVPKMLAESIKECSTTYSPASYGGFITCIDKTHQKQIDRMELYFDKAGRMTRYVTVSPVGKTDTTMQMSAKAWSNNKWVLESMKIKQYQGIQSTITDYLFNYEKVELFGFPKSIVVKTAQYLIKPTEKNQEQLMRETETALRFSNYVINKGQAKSAIISKP